VVEDEFTDRVTSVAGLRLHSRVIGPPSGRPMVVVPGLGMSNRSLAPLARALADRHRVWVLDPPGSGDSDRPATAPDVGGLADLLTAWIQARDLLAPVVVGVSLGCQVAVDAARRAPDLTAGLVLVSPPFGPRARGVGRQALGLARSAPAERLGLIAGIGVDWLRTGPMHVLRQARAAARYPTEVALAATTVPVLILRGSRDPVAPPDWVDRLADDAMGRVRVIAGAGHGAHDTAPGAVAAVIEEFLSDVTNTAPNDTDRFPHDTEGPRGNGPGNTPSAGDP
jgi:pimeloyl-ACP methyl ester carboxylesterase